MQTLPPPEVSLVTYAGYYVVGQKISDICVNIGHKYIRPEKIIGPFDGYLSLWRWWPSKSEWTFTGSMRESRMWDTPGYPMSVWFPVGVDPNVIRAS